MTRSSTALHLGASIARSPRDVYEFVVNPESSHASDSDGEVRADTKSAFAVT